MTRIIVVRVSEQGLQFDRSWGWIMHRCEECKFEQVEVRYSCGKVVVFVKVVVLGWGFVRLGKVVEVCCIPHTSYIRSLGKVVVTVK